MAVLIFVKQDYENIKRLGQYPILYIKSLNFEVGYSVVQTLGGKKFF